MTEPEKQEPKTDDAIMALIGNHIQDSLDALWDELTPDERKRCRESLLREYIEANW